MRRGRSLPGFGRESSGSAEYGSGAGSIGRVMVRIRAFSEEFGTRDTLCCTVFKVSCVLNTMCTLQHFSSPRCDSHVWVNMLRIPLTVTGAGLARQGY